MPNDARRHPKLNHSATTAKKRDVPRSSVRRRDLFGGCGSAEASGGLHDGHRAEENGKAESGNDRISIESRDRWSVK